MSLLYTPFLSVGAMTHRHVGSLFTGVMASRTMAFHPTQRSETFFMYYFGDQEGAGLDEQWKEFFVECARCAM